MFIKIPLFKTKKYFNNCISIEIFKVKNIFNLLIMFWYTDKQNKYTKCYEIVFFNKEH